METRLILEVVSDEYGHRTGNLKLLETKYWSGKQFKYSSNNGLEARMLQAGRNLWPRFISRMETRVIYSETIAINQIGRQKRQTDEAKMG